MVVQVCASVFTAAFVVCVIFFVRALRTFGRSLEQAVRTVSRMENRLDDLAKEASEWLQAARTTMETVKEGLQAIEPLLLSVRRSGQALLEVAEAAVRVSGAARSASELLSDAVTEAAGRAAEAVHLRRDAAAETFSWLAAGRLLWRKWRESP